MNLDLAGKHALVCGASEGIGRATAHELALLGADVTVLARREPVLRDVAGKLPRLRDTQRHGWIAADVSDLDGLRTRIEAMTSAQPVQILINNTAGPPSGPAYSADAAAFLDAFQRHLLGAQTAVQAVLPGMRIAQWGRIVNIVSTSVREPIANLGVSNTVRGAVAGWSKTLSRELAPFGVTVNNVLPGYTRTQRLDQILHDRATATGKSETDVANGMLATVPVGRFAQPQEIAAAIAFLASPAAGYINGVSLAVDGGRMQSI